MGKKTVATIDALIEDPANFLSQYPHLREPAQKAIHVHNQKMGLAFEKKIDHNLMSAGIASFRKRIMTMNGLCISDYFYEIGNLKYWGEATQNFSQKNVDSLIQKKNSILNMKEVYPEVDTWRWVIFFSGNSTPNKRLATKNAKKRLESNGWIVLDTSKKHNIHIKVLAESAGQKQDLRKIECAKVSHVAVESFFGNELNRDIDMAQVEHLAKLIIKYGFTSQITVVCEAKWVRGKIVKTGKYMLIDGHHRLAAVKYLRDVFGYVIPKLPTVVVDGVTTLDKKKVQELLTIHNTNTRTWTIPNYIQTHRKAAEQQGDVEKFFSYDTLHELYSISKKNGLAAARLLYRVGPVFYKNQSLHIDRETIRSGDYRLTKNEKENYMMPFIYEVIIPFEKWYMTQLVQVEDVSQLFTKTLYQRFRVNEITLDECKEFCNAFKNLKKNIPYTKDAVNTDMWNRLERIIERELV